MKPEHTKPFDLNSAKAGAPYAQRSGLLARIGIWDKKVEYYKLTGAIQRFEGNELEWDCCWSIEGKSNFESVQETDLVMLPLGYCEGKPVFVGDELADVIGSKFTLRADSKYSRFDLYKWPRTVPVMPIFSANTVNSITWEILLEQRRPEIELYWKQLDEYEGVKK